MTSSQVLKSRFHIDERLDAARGSMEFKTVEPEERLG